MVLSSFKAEIPPLSTKLLKVREDNYKVKYERGKGKGEVNAERLSCNDWFSSIQLTFMGGTAAVKANHFTWNSVSLTTTYVLNKYMPIYLSYRDMYKSFRKPVLYTVVDPHHV